MPLVLANRVQETATANTTVSFTLTGAVTGFQSFAVIGNTNTTYYSATDTAGNWEVGLGTYSTTGPTLTRTTVYASSNSGSPVTFSGGVTVFVTYPSGRSVNLNESGNVSALGTVSSGVWQGSTVGVAYGGTGVTASSGANSVMLRDANQNVAVNRLNQSNTTTTAAGGTTALTAASSYIHTLVGTGGQTYTMPDATTLTTGVAFVFNNMATGTLTLQDFAAGAIGTIPAGGAGAVFLTANPTVGGTWDLHSYLPEGVTFGTNAFNLGTSVVSGGTWQGGTIQPAYGGTGLTTFAGANNALYSTGATTLTAGTLPVAAGGTGNTSGQAASVTNSVTFNNGGAGGASGSTFNGSGALTVSYNTVGAPSTTGTNATGTWGISISGNASTATSATTATNVAGGAANRIPYNTAAATTAFIAAPTTSSTFLQWNGSAFTWAAASTSPAGSNTQIQFNNSGAFGASSNLTWNGASLTVGSVVVGRGGGNLSSNTVVGASALQSNTAGQNNTAIGVEALTAAITGSNNTAVGYQANIFITASTNSTAIGTNSEAVSEGTSVGKSAVASNNAVAVGYNALTQPNAVAIGSAANASGNGSIAIGVNTSASGSTATVVGNSASASGLNSAAIGSAATANNTSATSLGQSADAGGINSIAIGDSSFVANFANNAIAIGASNASAYTTDTIVIGTSTSSSFTGREIRIGTSQGTPGGGSGNILIGYGTDTFTGNPSNSIAIGDSITVMQSNATYMNKFRINPTTGLVGPAYGLTYDSTTHEVYAVTSGPPPPVVPAWFTYQDYSSASPATIDLPTGWSTSYSGPADILSICGMPGGPWGAPSPGPWTFQGSNPFIGDLYNSSFFNWSVLTSPTNLNVSSPPANGFAVSFIYGVQDDGVNNYFNVLGLLGNYQFSTSGPFYSGFPLFGSAPRYGHAVVFLNGNYATTATAPSGGTIVDKFYDSFMNVTVLFITYDDTAVSNIQAGAIPLFNLPSSTGATSVFWYNYT